MKKAYYLLPNAITQIGFKNIGEGPVEAAVRKKGLFSSSSLYCGQLSTLDFILSAANVQQ